MADGLNEDRPPPALAPRSAKLAELALDLGALGRDAPGGGRGRSYHNKRRVVQELFRG